MSSTIGTSTDVGATRTTHQRNIIYAVGLFWAFYSDGVSFVYRTSTDGIAWSVATAIIAVSTLGYNQSIAFDGVYVHYAFGSGVITITYRRGLLVSDGTITWSAASQTAISDVNYWYYTPTIAVDSSGYAYIGTVRGDVTTGANRIPIVLKNANNNGTWSMAAGYPVTLNATTDANWRTNVVALTRNHMVAVYAYSASVVRVKRLVGGSTWGTERTSTTNVESGFSISATAVLPVYESIMQLRGRGGEKLSKTEFMKFAERDNVDIVFLEDVNYDINLIRYKYESDSLGTEITLEDVAQSSTSFPVIGRDNLRNKTYVFWANGDHIYYIAGSRKGWGAKVDWIDETADDLASNITLQCFLMRYSNYMGVIYTAKTVSPYDVRFNTLTL